MYADNYDVQKAYKLSVFGPDTKPSISEVDDYCDDISAEMDIIFRGLGLSTPIDYTDVERETFLKTICVNGVLAKVYRSIGKDTEQSAQYQKLYSDSLLQIRQNPNILQTEPESNNAVASKFPREKHFRIGQRF